VVDAALFLVGPSGDYITGHTLAIDGGLSLPTTTGAAIAGGSSGSAQGCTALIKTNRQELT
jgi:hypothetical protein